MFLALKNLMSADFRQFILYISVGVATALIDVASMQMVLHWSKNVFLSLTLAYILAVAFNFYCHSKFTFTFRMSLFVFCKYISVVLLNYILTVCLVYLLVQIGWSVIAGKIFSLPVVAVVGFILSKRWVYK
jgi:putative flippase GtrA